MRTKITDRRPPGFDWAGELIAFLLASMIAAAMVGEWIWWTRSELGQ